MIQAFKNLKNFFGGNEAPEVKLNTVTDVNRKAVLYTGTTPEEGLAQLKALHLIGLKPEHKVLEIGCGALNAGIPIMSDLKKGNYVGIEPNRWLVENTATVTANNEIIRDKDARFMYNSEFRAFEPLTPIDTYDGRGPKFDFIIAHSVMSHASITQLDMFLKNSQHVLAPGGKLLFSLLLTNDSEGRREETMDDEWHYPGSVFVKPETLKAFAGTYFNFMEERKDVQQIIMASHDSAVHDWFLMENK